jgi:hypothetical protein
VTERTHFERQALARVKAAKEEIEVLLAQKERHLRKHEPCVVIGAAIRKARLELSSARTALRMAARMAT